MQDKAVELVKELKPGNSPLILIAMLNAHWPDKYRPNVVPTDDTAKELLDRLRGGGRRKDQASEALLDGNGSSAAVSEAADLLRRRTGGR